MRGNGSGSGDCGGGGQLWCSRMRFWLVVVVAASKSKARGFQSKDQKRSL